MQAIIKGLEKVKQEFAASENDGPVSETFRKVFLHPIYFQCLQNSYINALLSTLYSYLKAEFVCLNMA